MRHPCFRADQGDRLRPGTNTRRSTYMKAQYGILATGWRPCAADVHSANTASRSRRMIRARFCWKRPPSAFRGRRESRMRAAPAVSCAMCTKRCAHEHTGPAENTRPSLRNGFTAYIALILVRRALLPPSPVRTALNELDASFGRRNHTTSPYASATLVFATSASTASHRNVRDDGRRPSGG